MKLRYYELYWSELSMVEHSNVEAAMVGFKIEFELYDQKNDAESQAKAQIAAYKLAHAIRVAIETAWSGADAQVSTPKN